eukprot:scaffold374385_cov20-Prasinocladus_malaysianus.AAC.1
MYTVARGKTVGLAAPIRIRIAISATMVARCLAIAVDVLGCCAHLIESRQPATHAHRPIIHQYDRHT